MNKSIGASSWEINQIILFSALIRAVSRLDKSVRAAYTLMESTRHSKEASVDIKNREIPLAELRHTCDPAEFPFQTTAELSLKDEVIGQTRAVKATEFGLSIKNHGYNIFVSGVPGTGRNTIVKSIVKRIALERPVPEDWCYINHFRLANRPRAI